MTIDYSIKVTQCEPMPGYKLKVTCSDGTLSPLAQALMQTGLLPAGVTPEIITLSGGVGECYRHQPAA